MVNGDQIKGLLQCDTKLDLSLPFKIKGTATSIDFKLSAEALQMMRN